VLIAVSLIVSACGSRVAGDSSGATPASATPRIKVEVHCPTGTKLPELDSERPVAGGFTTAWVLRCGDEMRSVPGQGRWWFRVEERADTDAAGLLAALRRPDEPASPGTMCVDVAVEVPYFALVAASGAPLRPRVPRDGCGQPQPQPLAALRALPFRETRATRLYQEQGQESIDTGCGQMWTDALAGDTLAHTRPAASRRMWPKTPGAIRICIWRAATHGLPRLESAGTIAGPRMAALLARLDRLPAGDCSPQHHRFAVLEYLRQGWFDSPIYAELDGCRLVLRPDHTLGHLDQATARLITALGHS
jgi:hypothetical protein